MKRTALVVCALCLAGSPWGPTADAAEEELTFRNSSSSLTTKPAQQIRPLGDLPTVTPPTPAPPSAAWSSFREIPSISGQYSVGKTTVVPYLGAGFGNGYGSELDRSLNPGLGQQPDLNLRSLLGPNVLPNEFQMGVRIPF